LPGSGFPAMGLLALLMIGATTAGESFSTFPGSSSGCHSPHH
jgi:hypothetical protein